MLYKSLGVKRGGSSWIYIINLNDLHIVDLQYAKVVMGSLRIFGFETGTLTGWF